MKPLVFVFVLSWLAAPAFAEPPDRACTTTKWGHQECIRWDHFVHDTCQLIETVTARHKLDRGFFTRLIWQESRFDPFAKSHANAMGIAQFIRSTATLRGLDDPYNPADALEHSAQYLAEMTRRYGNVGLAAVGYNGGERRAEGLIDGTGGLAQETVDYVRIITGAGHETWVSEPPEELDLSLSKDTDFRQACYALAKNRRLSPPPRTEPSVKPWGVQIAFGTSKAAAKAKYAERTKRCSSVLKGETPDYLFEKSRASRLKGYYFARIGRDTSRSAWEYCNTLKASGCLCAVYRNKL
jgi:Transglycosylase SLT domain